MSDIAQDSGGIQQAVGYVVAPQTQSYTARDAILYALGVGAGADPLDHDELRFVYELHADGFRVLPTYPVTFPLAVLYQISSAPGLVFNPMMLVHGEQFTELRAPLPEAATVTTSGTITQVYDKGSGALLVLETSSVDEYGRELAFSRLSAFIRGLGGFGGERGPSQKPPEPPARPPDAVQQQATRPDQALLYRLSGDPNPLHADSAMAALGGFDRPILHGLCSLGFAGRAVLKHFCANDPARFKSISVRFSKPVFPGDTLLTEMWQDGDMRIVFRTRVPARDEVVLTGGVVELNG
jgi:3-hydroxyacyl-CoA dehydrogenase/3a,7a,12a-trihydroxy-5b-cholest-24-enoyl-CoA hydratase